MTRTRRTHRFTPALIALSAVTSPAHAQDDAAAPLPHPLAAYAGAYEVDPQRTIIVTFAPEDEKLLVLDFDALHFSVARQRVNPDEFSTGDESATGLRFNRDAAGAVRGLRWTIEGQVAEARRLDTLRIEEVAWSHDDVELAATVMIPEGAGRGPHPRAVAADVPGAIIIQGSGESARDNIWSQAFAAALARAGIAVLLPDKRGSGKSSGDWRRCGFEDLARDALTARDILAACDGVDAKRIGMVGLSQGGGIAPLAAFVDPSIAFVIGVSCSVTTPAEQVMHEITQDVRRLEVPDEAVEQVRELIRRKHAAVASIDAWPAYVELRTELIAAGLQQLDDAPFFPRSPGGPDWTFWRLIHDFDPLPLWTSIETPCLILYGREDEHDNVPVARCEKLLADLRSQSPGRDLTCLVFEGAGHGLWDSGRAWGALRGDVIDALLAWLNGRAAGPAD